MSLSQWITTAQGLSASDLHIEADTPLVVRVRGELATLGPIVPAAHVAHTAKELLGPERWNEFSVRSSADLSLSVAGVRCRINLFKTVRGLAIAVRLLSSSIRTLEACNLHPELRSLTQAHSGLIVLSGPTGCGKSTTLAALLQDVNSSRARNIITIESPIEHLLTNGRSFIRQREVPTHSPSYEQAIIDALREDPDIVVIGEMRTPEVMRLTLNAAETGHLVLTTMHSATCAEALYRICMSFPADIQSSIRAQLADCLVGVVCQQLDYLSEFHLLAPRCEILMGSSGAKGTIRAGQFSQIANVIQAGGDEGMWSFDRYRRWMQQKRDWTLPSHKPPAVEPIKRVEPSSSKPVSPMSPDTPTVEISDENVDLAELARRLDDTLGRK